LREISNALKRRLEDLTVPNHLAVIPDGNRRWAAELGLSVMEGHRAGFEVAKSLSRFCRRIGIHTLTIWAFSTENWKRDAAQVSALMALYEDWLTELLAEAIEEEVRVIHLGRLEGLPKGATGPAAAAGFPEGLPISLQQGLIDIENKTAGHERNVINLAINYGGEDEVSRAVGKLIRDSNLREGNHDGLDLANFLDTAGQLHPNPDVVWRTSGEMRSSGFLPLQSAYAELVFSPKFFPALTEEDVLEMVAEYSARIRRFGG